MKSCSLRCFLFLLCSLAFCSCTPSLRDADLVFVCEAYGEFGNAVCSATGDVTHVGIVDVEKDGIYVIDAGTNGVQRNPLSVFVVRQANPDGKIPTLVFARVKGLCSRSAREEIVRSAKELVGSSYDWSFLPDNGKYYCSELVCETYKLNGEAIFKAKPMNFLNENGEYDGFWVKLFGKLGMDVPQGELGSNPNDLFNDSRIKQIRIYKYDRF